MLRRTLIATAALLIPAGLVLVTAPQAAWALPNAHGIANCQIFSGHGTVSPGLTPAGSPGGVKINFTASLTSPAAGAPTGMSPRPRATTSSGARSSAPASTTPHARHARQLVRQLRGA